MIKSRFSSILVLCFLLVSTTTFAQSFSVAYDFNGTNCASNTVTSQPSNAQFSSADLTNITCASGSGLTLNTQNWTTSATPDLTSYIEFTISPNIGFRSNITSLSFKLARSTSGPTQVQVSNNSTGSFSSSSNFTGIGTGYTTYTWNANVAYTTSPVSFRIYGYNASTVAGAKQLKIDQILVNGNIAQIPQPTTVSTITATSVTPTNITLNFSGGDGSKRIVVAQSGSAVSAIPSDMVTYTASSVFGSGSQITAGNYVVYNGSGSSVTVTGVTSSTIYYFAVFEYNDAGVNGTENYMSTCGRTSATPTAEFIWNGSVSTDWTVAGNWTPSRTTPSISDVLLFNSGGDISVSNVATQTISQLLITNNSNVTLVGNATRTISIGGGNGTDVFIEAGSTLNLGSAQAVVIALKNSSNTLIADGDINLAHTSSQIKGPGVATINGNLSLVTVNGFHGGVATSIASSITSISLGTASTIIYNGTTAQSITTANYQNLTITGSGTKTAAGNLAITGNLTIAGSAVLDPLAFNVALGGNWLSYSKNAFLKSNSSFVTFNGSGAQSITCSGGESFINLEIAGSGTVSLSSAVEITSILRLTSGTLNSSGLLTLNMDQAKIEGTGTGSISGNIYIYKNVNALGSHYLGVPLSGVAASDMNDDTPVINPATNKSRLSVYVGPAYSSITDLTTLLDPFKGYSLYFTAGAVSLDYTGTYNHTASYSSNFSNSSSGFQLIGNPYPSALDWYASSGWTKTGVKDAIYIWNASTNSYSSFVGGSGTNGGTQYIPAMQGFFINTDGTGGTATIGVNNNVRTTAVTPALFRTAQPDALRIQLTGKNSSDETLLQFSDYASSEFDNGMDASKLMNPETSSSIFTSSGGVDYAINTLPTNTNTIVPLNLVCSESGDYTLNFTTNLPNAVLIDKQTNTETTIISGSSLTVNSTSNTRYALKFSNVSGTTSSSSNNIYSFEKSIYLTGFNASIETVEVYDMAGAKIMDLKGSQTDMTINANSLQTGLYIIKVSSNGEITSKKVIIN